MLRKKASRYCDHTHIVEGKLAGGGGEFGMMNANKESFFSLIIPSISV